MQNNEYFDLSKATPGNWEIDATTVGSIAIWASDERDNGILLASVHYEPGEETAEANARLMAASYDMYNALIGCMDAMSRAGIWTGEEPFMRKMEAVLEKISLPAKN